MAAYLLLEFETAAVGLNHYYARAALNDVVELQHDLANQFDRNAVAILTIKTGEMVCITWPAYVWLRSPILTSRKRQLGHLPREVAAKMGPFNRLGCLLAAQMGAGDAYRRRLRVRIFTTTDEAQQALMAPALKVKDAARLERNRAAGRSARHEHYLELLESGRLD